VRFGQVVVGGLPAPAGCAGDPALLSTAAADELLPNMRPDGAGLSMTSADAARSCTAAAAPRGPGRCWRAATVWSTAPRRPSGRWCSSSSPGSNWLSAACVPGGRTHWSEACWTPAGRLAAAAAVHELPGNLDAPLAQPPAGSSDGLLAGFVGLAGDGDSALHLRAHVTHQGDVTEGPRESLVLRPCHFWVNGRWGCARRPRGAQLQQPLGAVQQSGRLRRLLLAAALPGPS
jgi:hypothetical protein